MSRKFCQAYGHRIQHRMNSPTRHSWSAGFANCRTTSFFAMRKICLKISRVAVISIYSSETSDSRNWYFDRSCRPACADYQTLVGHRLFVRVGTHRSPVASRVAGRLLPPDANSARDPPTVSEWTAGADRRARGVGLVVDEPPLGRLFQRAIRLVDLRGRTH